MLGDYNVSATVAEQLLTGGTPAKDEAAEDQRPASMAARQTENDQRFAFVHKHIGDFVATMLMLVPDKAKVPRAVADALGFLLVAAPAAAAADEPGARVRDLSTAVTYDVPLMPFVVAIGQRLVANAGFEGLDTPASAQGKPQKRHVEVVESHIIVRGVPARDFVFLPRTESCASAYIASCKGCTIIVLSPVNYAHCLNCTDCTIILGPALGVLTLELCERTRVVGLCTRLRIVNCVDVKVNVWTGNRPVIKGDSRGVVAGPLSGRYPQVVSDIARIADPAQVIHGPEQRWRLPILVDAGGAEDFGDELEEKNVVFSVQSPEDFLFEPALGTDGIIAPPLPNEFASRLETRKRVVEETARLVQSTIAAAATSRPGGSAAARQDLHGVILVAFRDYLADINQMDAILDILKPVDDLASGWNSTAASAAATASAKGADVS